MPTTRPRHTLTETDDLRDVLDRARRRFPEARSRKALLEAVIRLGDEELRRLERLEEAQDAHERERLERLIALSTGTRAGIDFSILERVRHDEYPDLA